METKFVNNANEPRRGPLSGPDAPTLTAHAHALFVAGKRFKRSAFSVGPQPRSLPRALLGALFASEFSFAKTARGVRIGPRSEVAREFPQPSTGVARAYAPR